MSSQKKSKQTIVMKFSSHDHVEVDRAVKYCHSIIVESGLDTVGPLPLPTERSYFVVGRSPHVNSKAKDKYVLCTHRRLLKIIANDTNEVESISKKIDWSNFKSTDLSVKVC